MKKSDARIRILSIGVMLVAGVFIVKLYILQIVQHDSFVATLDKQRNKSSSVFNRGSIIFQSKNGAEISGATLKSGFSLAIVPSQIKNPEDVYNQLSTFITLDQEVFLAKANKKDDPYEELQKQVEESIGQKIRALKIPGVQLIPEKWRFYPGGRSASHVLGFMAFKEDEFAGRYGLERFYDEVLSRNESNLYSNFFVEIFSGIKKGLSKEESFEGDIVSTIEPTVQSALEESVNKIQNQFSSAETGGIIIDPKTGEIYALSSIPDFDVNNFKVEKDVRVFSNPMIEEVREMGSIIKPLTMAAGIDAGVVNSKTTYNDKGSVTFDTETVYNFDKKGRGVIDMQTVLSKSLNTGMAFVVSKMGKDKFREYMLNFGLGERTNIDLPNEAQNLVSNLNSPRMIEYVTASFGQGIALTPISTVRAFTPLANGGVLVDPHIVKRINYKNGFHKNIESKTNKQVLKKETAEEVTKMLVEVVDESLLNGKAKNLHYAVAAKTGTAQIANGGGYYDDRYLHSFVGYFPAYHPQFLVFLYTVYPKGVEFAANTLAEPFLDLSKFLINYYEVPPDR